MVYSRVNRLSVVTCLLPRIPVGLLCNAMALPELYAIFSATYNNMDQLTSFDLRIMQNVPGPGEFSFDRDRAQGYDLLGRLTSGARKGVRMNFLRGGERCRHDPRSGSQMRKVSRMGAARGALEPQDGYGSRPMA